MSDPTKLSSYLANLEDERNSATLYQAMSQHEKNPKLAEVYHRLALTEQGHADFWAEKLRQADQDVPAYKLTWRTRILIALGRRFGAQAVMPALVAMEKRGSHTYAQQAAQGDMVAAEQSHARLLRQIGQSAAGGMEGGALAQIEGRHRSAGGNAIRAAVLGANDGLLSNFSLVMGVAGAQISNKTILLTGLAGLLAGAISMALGEWVSVQSSRELYEKQIRTEKEEIAAAPEEEIEELSLIYQARGLEKATAQTLATAVMSNQESALETLSREELGIDPAELGGSALEAALTSFLLFAIGAILPVIPYLFTSGFTAIFISALLSAVGLFIIGATITLFTGRPVLASGMRNVAFGLVAAAVTYAIGRIIGVSMGG